MSNLFKKAIVITDLHIGLKSNSVLHNEDCWGFIQWVVKTGKENNCDTCFFLGDYHNNRASINILSLNYSLRCLEHLAQNFDRVLFIPGNHDLYYRDKRDVQSAEWAKHIPNIQIVNDFYHEGDVSIVPWLVGDDYKKVPRIEAKYMFGHFELPHFYMNAMVQMPDHGEIRREDFVGVEHMFSGHFHKRQTHNNITYVGNCFPHNYADAWDDDRGCMILEWGGGPKYFAWPDAPKYRTFKLSDVLDDPAKTLLPRTYARVTLDIPISFEEANFIKETFVGEYKLRELSLIPGKSEEHAAEFEFGDVKFESVDQIVTSQITAIDSNQYDPNILLNIYRNL